MHKSKFKPLAHARLLPPIRASAAFVPPNSIRIRTLPGGVARFPSTAWTGPWPGANLPSWPSRRPLRIWGDGPLLTTRLCLPWIARGHLLDDHCACWDTHWHRRLHRSLFRLHIGPTTTARCAQCPCRNRKQQQPHSNFPFLVFLISAVSARPVGRCNILDLFCLHLFHLSG